MSAPGGVLAHEPGLLMLDLFRRELRVRGASVPIGGRAFEILAILAQSSAELISKDTLMQRVWPSAIVEENALAAQISAIRKALGAERDTKNGFWAWMQAGWQLDDGHIGRASSVTRLGAESRRQARRTHESVAQSY